MSSLKGWSLDFPFGFLYVYFIYSIIHLVFLSYSLSIALAKQLTDVPC